LILAYQLDHIRKPPSEASYGPREYHIYFVPRKTVACVKILEDGGILGDIILGELPLLFIPLENDLLSLELDSAFKQLYFVIIPYHDFLMSRMETIHLYHHPHSH
jgi:vacuolar protein sorting-associated protein 33A